MSTRSAIAILNDDSTVTSIYCHSDGYPEWNGRILRDYYNSSAAAKLIISQGDCSFLDNTIAESRFYNTWRNENTKPMEFASKQEWLAETPNCYDAEYMYIYEASEWKIYKAGQPEKTINDIVKEMAESK